MTSSSFTKRLTRLGSDGAAHLVAPLLIVVLVAVGGAYMLVSSHANEGIKKTGQTSSAGKKAKKEKKGYMLVYGQEGRYNSVKILATNLDIKTHKCGGTFNAKTGTTERNLPGGKRGAMGTPLKISCTPTSEVESYSVYIGKGNKYTANYVSVDIDADTCTLVHFDPTSIRKVPAVNGSCQKTNETDAPKKVDPVVRVLPTLSKNKKSIAGFVEISVPGESLTKAQCAGNVSVGYEKVAPDTASINGVFQHAVKHVKPTAKVPNGYCVAGLSGDNIKQFVKGGGTYKVKVNYAGSRYMNPAAETVGTITIPAKQ